MQEYLLVTGQIAYQSLCRIAEKIEDKHLRIVPLKCTVAALMSTDFIARQLKQEVVLKGKEIIIIPGLSQGSLQPIIDATQCDVRRGPKDLNDLPGFFEVKQRGYCDCSPTLAERVESPVKIVAEIVDAARMTLEEIMAKALYYKENGADVIDLGGDVSEPFPNLREVICQLKSEGFTVSMDSHQKEDILTANQAGADLILSFTSRNLELAKALDCPVVVIPDDGEDLDSLYRNIDVLEKWKISYLVDPILPPLTMGLSKGICRYQQVRKDFPQCEMFMGLGNVTELIDADSIGINTLMVGIAAELRINYLLTTEVSQRAKGCIREISLARDLMQRAITESRVPKHLDYSLLTIKDPVGNSFNQTELLAMQKVVKDSNYRIFVADQIYMFNAEGIWQGKSAQEVFSQLNIDDSKHAFYLGRELEKAETALLLGKKYVQDSPLRWGYFNQEVTQERSKP